MEKLTVKEKIDFCKTQIMFYQTGQNLEEELNQLSKDIDGDYSKEKIEQLNELYNQKINFAVSPRRFLCRAFAEDFETHMNMSYRFPELFNAINDVFKENGMNDWMINGNSLENLNNSRLESIKLRQKIVMTILESLTAKLHESE